MFSMVPQFLISSMDKQVSLLGLSLALVPCRQKLWFHLIRLPEGYRWFCRLLLVHAHHLIAELCEQAGVCLFFGKTLTTATYNLRVSALGT